ncbi:MAG TPA: VOC family protein [Streptosporangiaceae bacterium]|nr:VOC family protein [Streptosporangiaceae bacterium]
MVQRDTPWPAGTPCWVDLGTEDAGRARVFYETLFGWETVAGPPESGGYVMCEVGGRPVAGLGPKMGPAEAPSAWTTYLASDDVDATAAKVKSAGGQVLAEPFDVMDVGRMSVAADPGGAVFGIWQPRAHTGMKLANEPSSVCWNENMSRNFDENKAFYQAVFGYDYDDMSSDGFRYASFKTSGDPMGGMGDLGDLAPAETPAHWRTYFGVSDTDEAVETVTKLGGTVIAPAWDTPYGRMAILSDDQGAAFAVMSVPEEGTQEGSEEAAG